jgi:hypothetical protein
MYLHTKKVQQNNCSKTKHINMKVLDRYVCFKADIILSYKTNTTCQAVDFLSYKTNTTCQAVDFPSYKTNTTCTCTHKKCNKINALKLNTSIWEY